MRLGTPGQSVVETLNFQCGGHEFSPGQRNKMPRAVWHNQKTKKIFFLFSLGDHFISIKLVFLT